MAFLVSPGVQVKEIDLTNVVPATSASIGAISGSFQWGPANTIVTVGSEQELVETFGQPNDETFDTFLSAAQFLSYGSTLRVVRAVGSSATNAAYGATGVVINNQAEAEAYGGAAIFAAKSIGAIGNSIGISVMSSGATTLDGTEFSNFNGVPSDDELHVVVFDIDGGITGTADTVLESFGYVSQAVDAKGSDGTSNYWVDVVNSQSAWINSLNAPAEMSTSGSPLIGTTWDVVINVTGTNTAIYSVALIGGVSDDILTPGELMLGYDMFADAETVEVSLLMLSSNLSAVDSDTVCDKLIAIADARKDCVAFVSPYMDATVNNTAATAAVEAWRDGLTSSSYAFADSTALYIYDKYNDKYRWVPAASSMAGLCANADNVADAWFSPAGVTRGNVNNVTKLAHNPVAASRDALYKVGVNPIVTFPGQGTMLWGDKTLQTKASAFDRVNVRRLFITLEKAISQASRASLFEFNDEFTRAQFRNMVEPFLRDVKGRRGITDFKVVCDDTNNTGDIIDTNRFVADIYIKPARSINFITLNFVATRTGVEFNEIAGGN
jgi:phage tail sheath protein FI